jgi:hypothetical protein
MAAEAELEIAVLRHQVAILRRQVKRPVYRTWDKAFLAAVGRLLPREAWGAFLVRPETVLRWHRRLVAKKWTRPHRPPGRPGLDPEVGELILRMGRQNPRWGYMRIRGELLKLGVRVSATTIATVLRRAVLGPAPRRGPTWSQFLRHQAAGILACDFLTVETIRLKTLYVLVWIELASKPLVEDALDRPLGAPVLDGQPDTEVRFDEVPKRLALARRWWEVPSCANDDGGQRQQEGSLSAAPGPERLRVVHAFLGRHGCRRYRIRHRDLSSMP